MNNLHDIRNSKKRKMALRKERIIMLSASAFVLAALTMTGIYVREKDKSDNDEYRVDLDELNKPEIAEYTNEIADELTIDPEDGITYADDLDADPFYLETDSGDIVNPQFSTKTEEDKKSKEAVTKSDEPEKIVEPESETDSAVGETTEQSSTEEQVEETAAGVAINYTFPIEQSLQLPLAGDILMNYSMDKTVYYETLKQYRYNPAVIISAAIGDSVTAATTGLVKSVSSGTQLGNTVTLDIGEGYELTYGQLENISVTVGQTVETGQVIGTVAKPSIFYSAEGTNLYLKLTHDQVPENPLAYMQ